MTGYRQIHRNLEKPQTMKTSTKILISLGLGLTAGLLLSSVIAGVIAFAAGVMMLFRCTDF